MGSWHRLFPGWETYIENTVEFHNNPLRHNQLVSFKSLSDAGQVQIVIHDDDNKELCWRNNCWRDAADDSAAGLCPTHREELQEWSNQ